jgi:hypothetical protein
MDRGTNQRNCDPVLILASSTTIVVPRFGELYRAIIFAVAQGLSFLMQGVPPRFRSCSPRTFGRIDSAWVSLQTL